MFMSLKAAYVDCKPGFFMSVVFMMNSLSSHLEGHILENIALISKTPEAYSQHDPGNYSCPYVPPDRILRGYQDTSFYWTVEHKKAISMIRKYSKVCTLLFAGVYADKYEGYRVVLVGLFTSAAVMTTLYLSIFNNNYIFLVMVALRRSSEGIILAALLSLTGKLALPQRRTTFVGVVATGEILAVILAHIVSRVVTKWSRVSQFSGFSGFVTAIWWWMICRKPKFPKIRKSVYIPWKDMLSSVPLYVICSLTVSCHVYWFIVYLAYEQYAKRVLFFRPDPELVVTIMYSLSDIFGRFFCGIFSDYIISRRYLLTSTVRKCFVGISLVIMFCTLVVITLAECNQLTVIGCCVVLYFTWSITETTAFSAILDLAPLLSGTVGGIILTFQFFLSIPVTSMLRNAVVSDNYKGDIERWSIMFYILFFIALAFTLPFIFFGAKQPSWSTGVPSSKNKKNTEVGLRSQESKTAEERNQQIQLDSVPGPSNSQT